MQLSVGIVTLISRRTWAADIQRRVYEKCATVSTASPLWCGGSIILAASIMCLHNIKNLKKKQRLIFLLLQTHRFDVSVSNLKIKLVANNLHELYVPDTFCAINFHPPLL